MAPLACDESPADNSGDGNGVFDPDVSICAPAAGGFSTASTNAYFPLDVGSQWTYQGEEDGEAGSLIITVLDQTRVIGGVTTRVLEEREFVEDELIEVSWNYYAEASGGTVCYFGEDVDIFEDGEISHEGAWCADEAGNAPGIIMPADPQVGQRYQNEVAPGVAEDEAEIVAIGGTATVPAGTATVPAGTFTPTILIEEFNPLDGDMGFKTFAAGTGLIIDDVVELTGFDAAASPPAGPVPSAQSCGSP